MNVDVCAQNAYLSIKPSVICGNIVATSCEVEESFFIFDKDSGLRWNVSNAICSALKDSMIWIGVCCCVFMRINHPHDGFFSTLFHSWSVTPSRDLILLSPFIGSLTECTVRIVLPPSAYCIILIISFIIIFWYINYETIHLIALSQRTNKMYALFTGEINFK